MSLEAVYLPAVVSFSKRTEIGVEGKNSRVFLAHDEHLDAEIVIKEMPQNSANLEKIAKEAKILYASSHPNVVQIQYACKDNDNFYIAMPFYRNGSLKSLMAERYLTAREIIRYSIQFINGIAHIHSKGLVHLDIKPDNILLSDNNEALLSDFGLSDYTDENGWYQLTCHYIKHSAPELYDSNPCNLVNIQFDIFQIGLTLYRMCVGDECFNRQFNALLTMDNLAEVLLNGAFPDRKIIPKHIPSKLVTIILKCLETDKTKRYNNTRAILNDLSSIDYEGLDWQYEYNNDIHHWTCKDVKGSQYCVTSKEGDKEFKVTKNGRNKNVDSSLKVFLLKLK